MVLSSESSTEAAQSILTRFCLEYPRLKAASKVLPDLIRLYLWLHNELKCLVDKEYACQNGLEDIITKGKRKFPEHHLDELYERVKGNF